MSAPLKFHYDVSGGDFTSAGKASVQAKKALRQLGFDPDVIRRVAIAMYEAEINMVIHAEGGEVTAQITPEQIDIEFADVGPGIPDIDLAMQEGYSTASADVRDLGFGAGMGLPNMRRYTDAMEITSEVGKGTRIWMQVQVKH